MTCTNCSRPFLPAAGRRIIATALESAGGSERVEEVEATLAGAATALESAGGSGRLDEVEATLAGAATAFVSAGGAGSFEEVEGTGAPGKDGKFSASVFFLAFLFSVN